MIIDDKNLPTIMIFGVMMIIISFLDQSFPFNNNLKVRPTRKRMIIMINNSKLQIIWKL